MWSVTVRTTELVSDERLSLSHRAARGAVNSHAHRVQSLPPSTLGPPPVQLLAPIVVLTGTCTRTSVGPCECGP